MSYLSKRSTVQWAVVALVCGTSAGTVFAKSPCDLVTSAEASRLLGVSAGKMEPQEAGAASGSCLIHSADGSEGVLKVGLTTVSRTETSHLREHMDDERGGDTGPNEEPWYEVSVPDPKRPNDRRLVIHRDRTTLTLDLHSSHQADAKRAFERVWHDIAERMPVDAR